MKKIKLFEYFSISTTYQNEPDNYKLTLIDIFQEIIDFNDDIIKIKRTDNKIKVSIYLDKYNNNSYAISEFGKKYKPNCLNEKILHELSRCIKVCLILENISLESAEVTWTNAGEFIHRSGILQKSFYIKADISKQGGVYSTKALNDFILEKKYRIRHVSLVFNI